MVGLCNMAWGEKGLLQYELISKLKQKKPWEQIAAQLFRPHYFGYDPSTMTRNIGVNMGRSPQTTDSNRPRGVVKSATGKKE